MFNHGSSEPMCVRHTDERQAQFPKKHLIAVSALLITVLTLIGLIPSAEVEANRTQFEIDIDGLSKETTRQDLYAVTEPDQQVQPTNTLQEQLIQEETERQALESDQLGHWQSIVVKSGDNLSSLFNRQGLSARVVYDISKTPDHGKMLTRIRPGQTLEFRINNKKELTQLRYAQNRLDSILFHKDGNGYRAEVVSLTPSIHTAYVEGNIKYSLFLSSQRADLTEKLTMELAAIFGWDIDFALDIRTGDSFSLVYEEHFLDGEKLGNGNILAATFTNQGTTYTAIRYTDSKGKTSYYAPDGKSMKKAFLRTPVDFTRISSSFNPNRLHPVFKTKRPHRGVDYAASTGTPIKAAGDGRIKFAGKQNGYGYVTYIEHPNNIVTVYAHQSRLNKRFRKGTKVRQGDIIGYVGQTGWATGPHLHYEFRVNGIHRNPVTVKLPNANPVVTILQKTTKQSLVVYF